MKKVNWELEEACVLYNFYIKSKEKRATKDELRALSELYNKRADILGIERDEKFRNVSGLRMQIAGFNDVATASSSGKRHVGKVFREVHQLYLENPQILEHIVKDFYDKYG